MTSAPDRAPGIFGAQYLWTTIGALALVFLNAFENLAVTTVMPVVSAALGGSSLYALAFAAPLAAGVIGLVAGGNWSDRSGPAAPMYVSGALFVLGLLLAGTAQTMGMVVVGRLVQGFGGGAISVALYVIVARIYPPDLHQKIFAGFAAAWVVPSLVGPVLAGLVAQYVSWHWVFLGVVGLVLGAIVLMVPAVRGLPPQAEREHPEPWAFGRIGWAVLTAAAVLALNLSQEAPDAAAAVIALVSVVVALLALRPLVPRGTLSARRGLPTVILVRGFVAAAFFGAEVYIPYLLIDEYSFDPALAGLALTGSALAWAGTSWLQGRLGDRLSDVLSVRLGSALVLAGILIAVATAAWLLSPLVIMLGWLLGAGGMGLMYPRLSTMTLARSTPQNQGFNSAAVQIADSLGAALALATTGLIVAAFAVFGGATTFAATFVFAAVLALAALIVAGRVAEPSSDTLR
ncbi:putative MFS family arabinose efflux permease [Homoserinimonas aerilata]|uniref:Putative MFS family arabinose efflux permease n=1 Tax=Homoserinimonas aerilata TaxID=1162970 RepID=A0A542YL77_9MICO|nr:MFS transporter [Homoserinimonas aerilata]TQL48821.1 putative MFS family arabinose efflux permease [Homoserinimonas aerilata]